MCPKSSPPRKKTFAVRVITVLFAALAAPALASCAVAGEKPAAAPRSEEASTAVKAEGEAPGFAVTSAASEPPKTIEEATAAIDQSERDLNQAVTMIADSSAQRSSERPATSPAPTMSPGSPSPPAQATAAPAAGMTSLGAGDACFSACRALASMRRSVDHLCGLTGDSDVRCEGARARVNGASARVHATCPACS